MQAGFASLQNFSGHHYLKFQVGTTEVSAELCFSPKLQLLNQLFQVELFALHLINPS